MSKFFFKGTQDKRENYKSQGYTNKGRIKLGSAKNPLTLTVTSESRKADVEKRLLEHELLGTITVNTDTDASEDISELEGVLNKPATVVFDKTPNRNDPCSCGSGKKYKKCCA